MRVREVNLTEGIVWKQVLRFALPLLLSNLLQQLYSTADLLILGNFSGRAGMAAVGAGTFIINSLLGLFIGLGTGGAVMVSAYYGAEDYRRLSKSVHTLMGLSLLASLLLTVLGLGLSRQLLLWTGTPLTVLDGATAYMQIFFAGTMANMIYNMGSGILRAVGDSQRPFIFLAVSVLVNVLLDLLFVAAFGWGVAGAAWATILSQCAAALLVLYSLHQSDMPYRLFFRDIRLDRQELGLILKIGLPAGLQAVLVNFSNVLIQSVVNSFGEASVAGFSAAMRLDGFIFTTISALSLAVMTCTGQNVGARRYDRVRRGFFSTLGICVGVSLFLGLFFLALAGPICASFNRDPEVIRYAVRCLTYMFPLYWVFGFNEVVGAGLRGTGRSLAPMLISLICMCALRMLWIFGVLPHNWSIDVVFMAYPLAWIVTFVVQGIYALKTRFLQPPPEQQVRG